MPGAASRLSPIFAFASLFVVFSQGAAFSQATAPAPPAAPLLGFSAERSAAQRELEKRFDAQLRAEDLRTWMHELAARPHHVGSPHGKANAERMAALFRSWGFDTQIEEFQVLFPTPKLRRLEMVAPTRFTAALAEPAIPEDPHSSQTAEQLPAYNAYSVDGDVTGELVYVNYGVPRDYEELERRGIDVRGKIVLARYGGSWRGIKPKVAAERGAVGCLIYSDPRDDGYAQGDAYPKGGWRPEHGVQRGSVSDMPLYPGDPLTPGVGATKDARRLEREKAPTLTKIPVLPISYADALPLLQAMGGPLAPEGWRGALATPYRLGPGPAKVRLQLQFDWKLAPAYDVIARLEGAERPDQWILRGNHHDAWVNGAADPVSGMVAELAEARALGELVKQGWRPKRTLVYAAWDAEEPGLLGSVEWAEAHAELLRKHAVVYINSDSNSRGYLEAGGSHTLETLVNQVAREVQDPLKKVSVAERLQASQIFNGSPEDRKEVRDRRAFRIYPLGSGSDYTPFLQHLGIASLNIGFGGEEEYGQYHSIYDTVAHYERFMDPTYEYGVALARTVGRLVLRLADADVLPFETGRFTSTVSRYVDEVSRLADTMREETAERNRRVEDRIFWAVDNPAGTWVQPKAQEPVPYLNFAPLRNAVATLEASTRAYERALERATADGKALPADTQKRLDAILMNLERALTRKEGLPRRPWYVHHIYAPGFYTGYGVKTLPGVREAIEERQWKEAGEQIEVTAGVIQSFAREVDRATALLGP